MGKYARNPLIHSSTSLNPFQCVIGYQPPRFPWSGEPTEVPSINEWFHGWRKVWETSHLRLQWAIPSAISFRPTAGEGPIHNTKRDRWCGSQLWISTSNFHARNSASSFAFKIKQQINTLAISPPCTEVNGEQAYLVHHLNLKGDCKT